MTSQTSEVHALRSRATVALRNTAQRTRRIAHGVEREFWNGMMVGLRWGKHRLRDLHTAFDRAVTRAEYRAGRSAEAAASASQRTPAAIGQKSNGGGRPAESNVSAPAF
jgi:hypothetical protein